MVGELSERPAAFSIRSVQIRIREAPHEGPEAGSEAGKLVDHRYPLLGSDVLVENELSHGILWVRHDGSKIARRYLPRQLGDRGRGSGAVPLMHRHSRGHAHLPAK